MFAPALKAKPDTTAKDTTLFAYCMAPLLS